MRDIYTSFFNFFANLYHYSDSTEMFLAYPKKIFDFCRYRLVSDERFVKKQFKKNVGSSLNLVNPKTFAEKIQWLKLNDRNPIYTLCADKYLVRDFVSNIIGSEYLIPIIDVLSNPQMIDFGKLPNKYIIKTNHASGTNIVISNNMMFYNNLWEPLDKKKIIRYYKKSLKINVFHKNREWEYKNIKPLVLIEELLSDESGNEMLSDYKIHCFNGKPFYIQTIHDREFEAKETWYDINWNDLDCYYFSSLKKLVERPSNLSKMLVIAEKLSNQFDYVRVDLYSVNNKIFFGELTFHPYSGVMDFTPSKWNKILGSHINLPIQK